MIAFSSNKSISPSEYLKYVRNSIQMVYLVKKKLFKIVILLFAVRFPINDKRLFENRENKLRFIFELLKF